MLVGFCRVVISLWIHQLLPQRLVSCWSGVHTVTTVGQRQREADKEKEGGGRRTRERHSTAVTQTSALILGSTPRWSEESHISSLRQTYDVDSGGISLTD